MTTESLLRSALVEARDEVAAAAEALARLHERARNEDTSDFATTLKMHAGILFARVTTIDTALSAPVGDGWFDIATAPKDGEVVLVFIPGSALMEIVLARHDAEDDIWLMEHGDSAVPIDMPVTHWRPLPPAPGEKPAGVVVPERPAHISDELLSALKSARSAEPLRGNGEKKDAWGREIGAVPADTVREALRKAIDALEEVERDTNYSFDSDFTPEEDRLIPRLRSALQGRA